MEIKLKPEVKTALLEALRSGEYTKTNYRLSSIVDGHQCFCIEGVICDLYRKQDPSFQWVKDVLPIDVSENEFVMRFIGGEKGKVCIQNWPEEVKEWAFEGPVGYAHVTTVQNLLDDNYGVYENNLFEGYTGSWEHINLQTLNDLGLSFDTLALIIEKYL